MLWPVIPQILSQQIVPPNFVSLDVRESGFIRRCSSI